MKVLTPVGQISKDLKTYSKKISRATKGGIVEGGQGLKNALREETKRAGLGEKVANTWQGPPGKYVYPKSGDSKDAAVSIVSHAPHIISSYDKGGVIRAKGKRFLAVPLPAAQKLIGAGRARYRITPRLLEEWMGIKLVMIDRHGKNPLLVARNVRLQGGARLKNREGGVGRIAKLRVRGATKRMGERTSLAGQVDVPMFVLVPQVTLQKRLNVEKTAREWGSKVPSLINKRMS